MILRYMIMYVENVEESLSFYERAFGLARGMIDESGDYGELVTGETKLAFSSTELMRSLGKDPAVPDPRQPVFEIAFETDDVEAAVAVATAAGAKTVQEVREEPWGQTTAYVTDLNGYLIEICSSVDPKIG